MDVPKAEAESVNRLTWYDTPERSSPEEIAARAGLVARAPIAHALLDGVPAPVFVVDRHRQIVATNQAGLKMLGAVPIGTVLGQRPGEAINCIHAHEMPAGCGTSQFCVECGAVQALRASREQHTVETRECRISITGADGGESALDLRVTASPFDLDGEPLTLFAVQDIADEKRRHALERIFFHDVLNTANGIDGVARLLPSIDDRATLAELGMLLRASSSQLIQEIVSQRDLLSAERGELPVERKAVAAGALLDSLHRLYSTSILLDGRRFLRKEQHAPWMVDTDQVLALRCLGNLVKNAIEATSPGGEVAIWADRAAGCVRFRVRNPGVMAQSVQLQMFHRSFSTKAPRGRGIGTYSVKLLAERYLGGSVSFESSNEAGGTIFTLELPEWHTEGSEEPRSGLAEDDDRGR